MTYLATFSETATGSGLARLRDGSSTTTGTNNKILWAVNDDLYGSSVCSVASGVITLPVGYYYLLEGSTSARSSIDVFNFTMQFYDENSSAYVGTESFLSANYANVGEDFQTFSMDDASRVWVDATSTAGSISFRQKITSTNINGWDVAQVGPRNWTGYGRCLVWRFD